MNTRLQRIAEWWWVGLVAGATVTGAAIVQWLVYRDEAQDELRSTQLLQQSVSALRAIAPRLEEFDREWRLLKEKTAAVRRVLPVTLNPSGYVTDLRPVCARYGFTIAEWTAREAADGRVRRATLDLTLDGSPQGLQGLGSRVERMARLTSWDVVGSDGDRVWARMEIYALPPRAAEPIHSACLSESTKVWLWPFTRWRDEARRGREAVCRELEQLRPIQRQVDAFERERAEYGEIVDVAERLMAKHGRREVPPEAPEGRAGSPRRP